MSEIKTLKIKNSTLDSLVKATSINLPFERSRIRNQFIKALTPHIEAKEKSRLELIKKFATLDEKGEPKIVGMQFDIPKEKQAELNVEFVKFLAEEVIIDVLPSIEPVLKTIKAIIVENTQPLTPEESVGLIEVVDAIDTLTLK